MNVDEPVPSNQISDLLHIEMIANTFEVNADFYINSISGVVNTSYDNQAGSSTSLSYDYDIDVSICAFSEKEMDNANKKFR